MNVTDRVRADLVRTLAVHFPEWDRRERVVTAAGLPDAQLAGDPQGSWRCIVDQAIDERRLPQLLMAASRAKPDAADLRDLANQASRGAFAEPAKGPSLVPVFLVGVATVALGVVMVGLVAKTLSAPPTPDAPTASLAPPPPPPAPAPEAAPPPKARKAASEPPAVPPGATIVVTPVAADAPPVEEAVAPPPSEPVAAVVRSDAAVVRLSSGPCAGAAIRDGVIGYAYAGEQAPTVRDGTWRVPGSVNVRADYPDEHNGYDARAAVVCAAPRGGLIELGGEPLAVPGGAWWVPVADVRGP